MVKYVHLLEKGLAEAKSHGLAVCAFCYSVSQWRLTLCNPMDSRTTSRRASLSITISRSLLKLMSVELVMLQPPCPLSVPLSSYLQSFPASGSVPMGQLFASGGQSIGALCIHGVCVYEVLLKHCHSGLPWWSSG